MNRLKLISAVWLLPCQLMYDVRFGQWLSSNLHKVQGNQKLETWSKVRFFLAAKKKKKNAKRPAADNWKDR